jgi:ammonia channel protein AmtB
MQAGFALVETGLCRAKSAAHVMSTNFMIYGLGMLGFWICGFAIMFGGVGVGPGAIGAQPTLGHGILLLNKEFTVPIFGKPFGLWGGTGFFLGNNVFDTAIFTLFLFEMVFMDTTATIPTGAMAERWNFKNFILYGFWVGMLPYALFGNWVWGGGWLAQLGLNFGLGHGHVDFAGSSVVHQTGGMIALAGAWILGARLGKYGLDGKPRATIDKFNDLLAHGWSDQGVTGCFGVLFGAAYNDWSQLGAEFVGTFTNLIFVAGFAFVWFKLSNLIIPLRSKPDDETAGLDVPEMGAEAYPDYNLTDKSSPPVSDHVPGKATAAVVK